MPALPAQLAAELIHALAGRRDRRPLDPLRPAPALAAQRPDKEGTRCSPTPRRPR